MKKLPSLHDQIARKCIHFSGLINKTCDAFVSYDSVKREGPVMFRFPCLKEHEDVPCAKREWPTEEHVAGVLAAFAESDRKMMLASGLIKRIKTEHKGEDWQGVENCPACKGRLHLSISAYNGHVWGRCETKDCLAWME